MKLIQYLLMPFYRAWFYLLVMVGITLFSPLLFLGTVRERWYKIYFTGARLWGMFVLFGMGFIPKVERRTQYV
ncbi:MAG TPA: 1-acyl-sn-glycerol-3-phosphate acyltransferase, partial [Flavobacteriaceae bacterium]|nr:1-acyl-sn-glycerol-3-phosphate acyltransferase [Flavobacteriaceae bacterium]